MVVYRMISTFYPNLSCLRVGGGLLVFIPFIHHCSLFCVFFLSFLWFYHPFQRTVVSPYKERSINLNRLTWTNQTDLHEALSKANKNHYISCGSRWVYPPLISLLICAAGSQAGTWKWLMSFHLLCEAPYPSVGDILQMDTNGASLVFFCCHLELSES